MWENKQNYSEVTWSRYAQAFSWPLTYILPYKKRWTVRRNLKASQWSSKTLGEVQVLINNL